MAQVKAAIPQLAWDRVRPAVILVSGTESVLADRAIRRCARPCGPKTRASS